MNKYTNFNTYIFNSNLNNKYKTIPFNIRSSDLGEVKYMPPVSKEWKNTIYSYYNKNTKNLPICNINANKIIKSYFDLYFKNNSFAGYKYIGLKKRRNFLRKIYTSKIETKHTNSKILITLYTINVGKNVLYKNYIKFSRFSLYKTLNFCRNILTKEIKETSKIFTKHDKLSQLLKYKSLDNKKLLFALKL